MIFIGPSRLRVAFDGRKSWVVDVASPQECGHCYYDALVVRCMDQSL